MIRSKTLMMYDGKTLQRFTERAMKNYELLTKYETKYDITITLCTLCGILSILDDKARKDIFVDFKIPKYIEPLPHFSIASGKDNGCKKLAIIRHFRNSLCHFKLDGTHIKPNTEQQIEEIIFEDYFDGQLKFSCTLKADQIKQLLIDISNHIIKQH